jgi:hypothetical protein
MGLKKEERCGLVAPNGRGPCVRKKGHPALYYEHTDRRGNMFRMPPNDGASARRVYYPSLEEALREFGMVDGVQVRQVLEAADDLLGDEIAERQYWMTPSMGYVAVGDPNAVPNGIVSMYIYRNRIVDEFGYLYQNVTPVTGCPTICSSCFTALPTTGLCDYCG